LDEYIQDAEYGYEKDAVCFAFTLHERENNDYELELFFNDAVVLDYRSIPD
jgi:sulfur relay (sulfurtransferase) complex TusBCD TusD component (DsrE family)